MAMARPIIEPKKWNIESLRVCPYDNQPTGFHTPGLRHSLGLRRDLPSCRVFVNCERSMVTLRVVRHDRDQLLAECSSTVIPARGEVLQLDTFDEAGKMSRPSTLWR